MNAAEVAAKIKRAWCGLRGHGGVRLYEGSQRWATCKRCGALIDVWPREWQRQRPEDKKAILAILQAKEPTDENR